MREQHPLVIPQIDPDKYDSKDAETWFDEVKSAGISFIAMGGSIVDTVRAQKLLDMAINNYDFIIALYLIPNLGSLKGRNGRTAIYWTQVPHSLNSFYGWDGLIANSLQIERTQFEPIPTLYVFDDRDSVGVANWITRGYPIPRDKPEISLAVAKAAEYFGVRFYIMAGGSGSAMPPSPKHVEKLTKHSKLFVIPTSGINNVNEAKELFDAGADAIHIGNRLEMGGGFGILKELVKLSEKYPGRKLI